LSIVIDTAIAMPAKPDLATASDTGSSAFDNRTRITTPTLTGTAEPESSVTVSLDGLPVATLASDAGGNWSFVGSPLADGVHAIAVRATDVAGNASAVSSTLSITIDSMAPPQPTLPDLQAASDSGFSNTDDITRIKSPTFTGFAEVGSTVRLYSDRAGLLGSSTTNAAGRLDQDRQQPGRRGSPDLGDGHGCSGEREYPIGRTESGN
jgi:hypothetical protein